MYKTMADLIRDLQNVKYNVDFRLSDDDQTSDAIGLIIAKLQDRNDCWQIRSELEGYEETWLGCLSLNDAQTRLRDMFVADLVSAGLPPDYRGKDAWISEYDSHICIPVEGGIVYANRSIMHTYTSPNLSVKLHHDSSFRRTNHAE